jgi:hypothetical protein
VYSVLPSLPYSETPFIHNTSISIVLLFLLKSNLIEVGGGSVLKEKGNKEGKESVR